MEKQPLIIGYGNSLRTDDGAGWHAAAQALADKRFQNTRVLQAFQLLPEMAYDIAEADLLILLDARESLNAEPGTITTRTIQPMAEESGISSHHVTPEALLALTAELGLEVPRAFAVEIAARHFDDGPELTHAVAQMIPTMLDVAASLIAQK